MTQVLVSDLVSDTRVLADVVYNNVVTDDDVATFLFDAASELYDVFVTKNEHYNISQFVFMLPGGVGGNTQTLPDDFQQGHGLEINPNTVRPISVRYLSNWLDRNNQGGSFYAGVINRSYVFSGDQIMVFPPTAAGGTYGLWYTPKITPLQLPSYTVNVGLTDSVLASTGHWTFSTATFDDTMVGQDLVVAGTTAAGDSGTFTILSVVAPHTVVTASTGLVNETFSTGTVTASVQEPGTTAVVPPQFNSWLVYMKTYAARMISTKTDQTEKVAAFSADEARLKARILSVLDNRQEEPRQPPLTRNRSWMDFIN